jgi:hypothetical protein
METTQKNGVAPGAAKRNTVMLTTTTLSGATRGWKCAVGRGSGKVRLSAHWMSISSKWPQLLIAAKKQAAGGTVRAFLFSGFLHLKQEFLAG